MGTLTLTPGRKAYPALLKESPAPPRLLYYRGDAEVLSTPCVSMVGSRKMTAYGQQVLKMLVPALVRAGLTIVSGLAHGIDGEAHRIALEAGGTCVAVLGNGFDRIYPQRNRPLLEAIIAAGGCAVTEYDDGVGPQRYHFPARNRIVAGLSRATVVVEAGENSGTLITARCALDAGRDLYVVPGDITREGSRGILRLLSQGAAAIRCPDDVLASYAGLPGRVAVANLKPALTGAMATLYDLVSHGGADTDTLIMESGYAVSEVQSVLSVLELDGYLYRNGTLWQRTS